MANTSNDVPRKRHRLRAAAQGLVAASATAIAPATGAFEFGDEDGLQGRWDNTVKYSAAWRVKDRSPSLLGNLNTDDGDRNFDKGLISSRVDLLSELDLTYKSVGLRVSGAAWYDSLYNRSNNNDSPATANVFSVPFNEFSEGTEKLHGRKAEILDAFTFANGRIGGAEANVRAGRHTLLWGESLLLATNGISYAQAPLDVIKSQAVPASQAKELFMPVGQVSAQVQPTTALSFAAYYQFEWRPSRLPGSGSYFSSLDLVGDGAESVLLARRPGPALLRGNDVKASDSGQWGISARYYSETLDTEFGLYYARFNDKLPKSYLQPGARNYVLVYPEDISLFGASFSTGVGVANVAGEIHVRRDMPLNSTTLTVLPGTQADNRNNPLYAVGDTVHAQVSVIYPLSPGPLWQGGTVSAEVGALRVTSFTRNAGRFDPTKDRSAWGWSLRFTPSYTQVIPNLDMTVPVSLAYNPRGNSPLAGTFMGHKAGTFSIGVNTEYQKTWNANFQYTVFFGGDVVQPFPDQPLADRNFVSLSIQRTF